MSSLNPQSFLIPGDPVPSSIAAAPVDTPTSDERTLAMLAELLQLFSWMIGPLIIFFVKRDSKFVRFHALQAILWQALLVLLYIGFFAALIPTMIMSSKNPPVSQGQQVFPWFIIGFWIFFAAAGLANMVFAIYHGVKANGGHWSRYPIIGRIAGHFIRPSQEE